MARDAVVSGGPATDELAATLRRTEVQRGSSSVPGREIVQVLTEIPEGVESGWHTHPGEEVGYILAGTVQMEIRGADTLLLHAGDGFLIPLRTPHNARDLGPGTGRMLSTYLVEIGEPLATVLHGDADRPAAPRPRRGPMPAMGALLITRDHIERLLPVLELAPADRQRLLALDYPVRFAVVAELLGGMGISPELLIDRMGGSP